MSGPQTADELLALLGVGDAPIEAQREAIYDWLPEGRATQRLIRDLARRGLVGPVVGDEPHSELVDPGPGGWWHLSRADTYLSLHRSREDAEEGAMSGGPGHYRIERRNADGELLEEPIFLILDGPIPNAGSTRSAS